MGRHSCSAEAEPAAQLAPWAAQQQPAPWAEQQAEHAQQQHQQQQHHHHHQQQQQQQHVRLRLRPCGAACPRSRAAAALRAAWRYVAANWLELPANALEANTLVLVVFVQDTAFKESVAVCAALLTASLCLHGAACRAGQCQLWPKVIELVAPLLFYALLPLAYVPATAGAAKAYAFVIINFWFVVAELGFMALRGRNFMAEYMNEWNPRAVWGTPLLQRAAAVTAGTWIVCQAIMGLAQVVVVVAGITWERNAAAALFMCYIMQLLPLLVAVVATFAYPAWLKRRWGYVPGVRETAFPPPRLSGAADAAAAAAAIGTGSGSSASSCSSGSLVAAAGGLSGASTDAAVLVLGEPRGDGAKLAPAGGRGGRPNAPDPSATGGLQ